MEKLFYRQQCDNTCGIGVFRTVLHNNFGINIGGNEFVEKAYKLLKEKRNGKPLPRNYEILTNGTNIYHFRNMAEYFGLKTFSSSCGKISHLEYLIDNGIWPIVHRKFEFDDESHYIVVYNYDGRNIHLFDPLKKVGGFKKEGYTLFNDKWLFKNEKWFIFFYQDGKIKIPFKGKYL